jgi:hypothetical protein
MAPVHQRVRVRSRLLLLLLLLLLLPHHHRVVSPAPLAASNIAFTAQHVPAASKSTAHV